MEVPIDRLTKVEGYRYEDIVQALEDAGIKYEVESPPSYSTAKQIRWSKIVIPVGFEPGQEESEAFYNKLRQSEPFKSIHISELNAEVIRVWDKGQVVEETVVWIRNLARERGYSHALDSGDFTPPHTPGTDW